MQSVLPALTAIKHREIEEPVVDYHVAVDTYEDLAKTMRI